VLVVIGPRHLDNQPSKFFEYLGHRKPILVLGPIGNPIQAIVNHLGIGIYCDILDSEAIAAAIARLVNGCDDFVSAYEINQDAISRYSAPQVARLWVETLQRMLDTTSKQTL
jgi:glycosyltransferase involved in cell wall biosynthesis